MTQEEIIFEKIEGLIPDFKTFENRIISHIQNDYFPLIYQCLYERIMPPSQNRFSTENFKVLLNNKYLWLLNDIYSTRISDKAFDIILKRLNGVDDFNDYEVVLKQFEGCNPKNGKRVNAFSLGTKVLHTYDPEENPILDSVIRTNLKIGQQLNFDLCVNFKKAMKRFALEYEEYFSFFEKSERIKDKFEKHYLKLEFPKMKILDMVIYYEGTYGYIRGQIFTLYIDI